MSWEGALILREEEGEKIVKRWTGNYETKTKVMVSAGRHGRRQRPVDVKERKPGTLILTNQRMVWLERRGLIGTSYHTLFEIQLENLKGISMGGAVIKYISLTDTEGENVFHLDGIGSKELELFKKTVFDQVEVRKRELEEAKKKERIHVLLDFSFLKNYMEKGGLVMQTVKCPECTAPIKLPESGDQVKCEHCGSTVYAQDIFDKVKGLIG